MKCHTIPAGIPFLRTLAQEVLSQHGDELQQVRLFLPNRRACRALQETFLDLTGGKPLLLPRLRPIGDLEDNDLPADLLAYAALPDLPPAIAPERRLMLLMRLVMEAGDYTPPQAVHLARHLARFLDEILQERLDISTLGQLAPRELAEHWQHTLRFLEILSQYWPRVLADEGVIDAVARRNHLLSALEKHWQKHSPAYPVIAAGSTGTQPATAALLAVIARLPQGRVVLPGMDIEMPDDQWEHLSPTHPQYTLKQLLGRMGISRREVMPLTSAPAPARARVKIVSTALQPPETTATWAQVNLSFAEGLQSMQLLTADTEADEARLIAIAMRQALATPGKTVALVTSDRQLARRVSIQMERFGISVDDSAGTPFAETPAGNFLRLVIDMVAAKASPAALLAALRHPLAAVGVDPAECRRLSRVLEIELLRGIRPESGWRALSREATQKNLKPLAEFLCALETHVKPLSAWFVANKKVAADKLLAAHLQLAEWMAIPDQLWAGDDANQLAQTLARLQAHAAAMPDIPAAAYPAWFKALLAGEVYRPRFGRHPRAHILSPIEARLQQYDLVILGGLNEGSWPAHPAADPWMSRPMRETFGLPPLDRGIGQSAHDFFMLVTAPQVILTRALKIEGKPTIPSRWLVRLLTLLEGKDKAALEKFSGHSFYDEAREFIDAPIATPPIKQPRPVPPVSARPREISATDFDHWQRDPYMIYAKRVLGLHPLDPLDQDPEAAEFGTLVHDALALFAREYPEFPDAPYEKLLEAGRITFKKYDDRPAAMRLWWPRFETMAAWIIEREKIRRMKNVTVLAEQELRWQVAPEFAVKARADRIEIDKAGHAVIADYKTGVVPSQRDIENGFANQLPIEALMLLEEKRASVVDGLEYWKLSGYAEECAITSVDNAAAMIEQCRVRLNELIKAYRDPATPFAAQSNPKRDARYNDYEHLTRRKEWGEA